MSELDLKIKIQGQNNATPALTELLNQIKALIEQARVLNTLLNLRFNVQNNSGNLSAELHNLELQAQHLQNQLNLRFNVQNNASGSLNAAAQSAQNFGNASRDAAGGVRTLEEHAGILHTRLNQFIALQVAQVVTGWGRDLVHTAEAYQTNSAKLRLAIKDTQEYNAVHQELFEIAQRSRGSLDQTTNAFVRNAESIKHMGGTTEQALLSTELLNKAIASTSMGASQDASALMQWNQALGKGILNGDELNSILENSLGLTKAIADGMDVPIGKLKELGEQGKLTGTDLINALFKQRDAIESNFNAIPVTISQSLTAVENAFQKYIGEANTASGTTQTIGKAIMEVAKSIPEIVSGLTTLAGIYGVRLTSSLVAYIAQMRIQKAATIELEAEAERLNYVHIRELETQQAVAAASVTASRAKLQEARLDAALAISVADRTAANEALALSIAQVTAAEERYIAASAALTASTMQATESMTLMQTVANGLKTAFSLLFAAWAGWEVGTFLRKFEVVRDAGSYLSEMVAVNVEIFTHFFSGDFLTGEQGLIDKIKAVHQSFSDGRAADSDDAQTAQEASNARHEQEIKAVEVEKIAKQEAFKETVNKLKETGAAIDAETARQNQALKTAIEQRKADIAGSVGTELQKELLITQAVKASQDAQMLIIQQSGDKKLAIVEDTYNKQLNTLKAGTVEQLAVEKESMTARLEVYQGLEKSYSGMIGTLIAEETKLATAAKALSEQRKGIEQSYADFKLQLHQLELTDQQKTDEDVNRLRKLASEQKRALAHGDFKQAEELDLKILELGKKLALSDKQKAEDAKKHGKVYFDSVDEIVRITDKAQANILKTNDAAQNATKQRLDDTKAGAENAKTQLQDVQKQIAAITNELTAKRFMLMMTVDSKAVDEAIARITKPTSSTHTINVVTVNSAESHATGGLITGKGTGTSDEIPALLSNGEYVIPADIVAKNGVAAFDAIKNGKPVQKFASGGLVGDDALKQKADEFKKRAYEQAKAIFDDPKNQIIWRMGEGKTSTGSEDPNSQQRNFERRVGDYLKINNLPIEWRDLYFKGAKAEQVLRTGKASFEDKAKAQLELDNQFATPKTTATTPTAASVPLPASIAAPVMPSITPAGFNPVISHSNTPISTANGKVSTIKFERPDGQTTTGNSTDPNFAKFFEELNTVSGVTKV